MVCAEWMCRWDCSLMLRRAREEELIGVVVHDASEAELGREIGVISAPHLLLESLRSSMTSCEKGRSLAADAKTHRVDLLTLLLSPVWPP